MRSVNSVNSFISRFNNSFASYGDNATVQRWSAKILSTLVMENMNFCSVYEIGCGTGILMEELIKNGVDKSSYLASDVAENMVLMLRDKFIDIKTSVINAETDVIMGYPDLIIGNFVAQWFLDLASTFVKLKSEGKKIAFSIPLYGSLSGWDNFFIKNFGKNVLWNMPHEDDIKAAFPEDIIFYEIFDYNEVFDSYYDFAKHLKGIGASYSLAKLSVGELRFLKLFKGKFMANYRVLFIAF